MVKRYNSMYYAHRFGDRFTLENGAKFSVSVWSMEGFPTSEADMENYLRINHGLQPGEYDINFLQ